MNARARAAGQWATLCAAAWLVAAPLAAKPRDVAQAWISSEAGPELLARQPDLAWSSAPPRPGRTVLRIDAGARFQQFFGVGTALTDASVILLQALPTAQRATLLAELFGPPPGLGLSILRLPIGASDFSTLHYSLDDTPDNQPDPWLKHYGFDPQRLDSVSLLRAARKLNPQLKLMASPWSAPAWMKDTGSAIKGHLIPMYYGAYTDYLLRVVQSYESRGLPLYALTVQNEPGFEPKDYPGMRMDADERAEFIGKSFGPRLAKLPHAPLLLDYDHNWDDPLSPAMVLDDPAVARYVAGVAWHCYRGDVSTQSTVHAAHPDKLVFITECSGGEWRKGWEHTFGWFVGTLLVDGARNWSSGTVLWNLALDPHHGPHMEGCNNCSGIVTIEPKTGEVTRNLEYYALAHFTRCLAPGAVRVGTYMESPDLHAVAFANRDGSYELVGYNAATTPRPVTVRAGGRSLDLTLPAASAATVCWGAPGKAERLLAPLRAATKFLDRGGKRAGKP